MKLLIIDVDGVMTDSRLIYTNEGEEIKSFHVRDGIGIEALLSAGVSVAFLSAGRASGAVEARAKDLNVTFCATGVKSKLAQAELWTKELGIEWNDVGVIGDDLQDLELISIAGWSACPSDAYSKIIEKVDLVLTTPGGAGCVREASDYIAAELLRSGFTEMPR